MQPQYNPNIPLSESDKEVKARRDLEAEVDRLRKQLAQLAAGTDRYDHAPLAAGTSSTVASTMNLPSDDPQSIVDSANNWVSLAMMSRHPVFIIVVTPW